MTIDFDSTFYMIPEDEGGKNTLNYSALQESETRMTAGILEPHPNMYKNIKTFKIMVFITIRTKHNLHIFRVIIFIKLNKQTSKHSSNS